jgi:hypothetical protein
VHSGTTIGTDRSEVAQAGAVLVDEVADRSRKPRLCGGELRP